MTELEELQTLLNDPLQYIPRFFKVLTKADENGISSLVPMVLKPMQAHYAQHRTHRDFCLKGRQMGFSTGLLALDTHADCTIPYQKHGVIAHKEDMSKFMLQTVHRFLDNLPQEIRPKTDWQSSELIRFPLLDSLIHIDSAESKTIGRSETFNRVHLSEVAMWAENKANELFSGITQATPIGGYITIETTPKGRGGFAYRLYTSIKNGTLKGWTVHFYPWWWEPEYKLDIDHPLYKLYMDTDLTTEEILMVSRFNLTNEQIAFRRLKIAELRDLFFQEYPENDVDCWLQSENNVFDGIAIRTAMKKVKEPSRVEGNLSIWKDSLGGNRYIIGADVGNGMPKGDFSVACVLDLKTSEHVATLRGRIHTDKFGEDLIRLGRRYNDATIAVERNNSGLVVLKVLIDNHYRPIYRYKDFTKPTDDPTNLQPGWLTTSRTRPFMIETLNNALISGDLMTQDEVLLTEMASFIYKDQRAEAPDGEHDDSIFAMMVALCVRQDVPITPVKRSVPFSYV